MVCEKGSKWPYNCCFIGFFYKGAKFSLLIVIRVIRKVLSPTQKEEPLLNFCGDTLPLLMELEKLILIFVLISVQGKPHTNLRGLRQIPNLAKALNF